VRTRALRRQLRANCDNGASNSDSAYFIANTGVYTEACAPYNIVSAAGPAAAAGALGSARASGLLGRQPAGPRLSSPRAAGGHRLRPCRWRASPTTCLFERPQLRCSQPRLAWQRRRHPSRVVPRPATPARGPRARAQGQGKSNAAGYCAARCSAPAPDKSFAVARDLVDSGTTYYNSNGAAFPDKATQSNIMRRIKSLIRKHVRRRRAARAVFAGRAGRRRARRAPETPPPRCAPPKGAVNTAFTVYEDFQSHVHWTNPNRAGVYTHTRGSKSGGHAVAVVGGSVRRARPEAWPVAGALGPR
jgi:hypothetical protein